MAETEALPIKIGGKVKYALVVGGFFDQIYKVHALKDNCAVLANCKTRKILRESERSKKPRMVPLCALKTVP